MSQRREFRELADPETVRETIDSLPIEPHIEKVPIENAGGRVIAERIDAGIDVPGFDRATMDGFAVQASDTFGADERDPVHLDRIGAVHAGARPSVRVESGQTAEISTGAVLPPGADAVVIVERAQELGEEVAIETGVAPGENVMAAGTDIGAGRRLIGPGRTITARDIAGLAAIGKETVSVRVGPRVGIVSTGDELVRPGESIDHGRGQIYDVNSHTIAAAVRDAGGEPHVYPHVGDDYDLMYEVLSQAADECDLIISSGSTSASAVDVIYRVIEEGGELLIHGVAMKPGKPMIVGMMGDAAYVGLPGYPVSALMIFRQFVADRIRSAAGLPAERGATEEATMVAEERFGEGRLRLLPIGTVYDGSGDLLAYPVDKGSGATTSLSDADGVVEVPADTTYVAPGERVTVNFFANNVRPATVLAVGKADPRFVDALDAADNPRFLPVGSREGRRRFERGIPDLAVLAQRERPSDNEVVGSWEREWGLLVPAGNPDGITGIEDLVDRDLRFANLQATSLRGAFDQALSDMADERERTRVELANEIVGYGIARTAHESAAQLVVEGEANIGLGLASSTEHLPLDLVALGREQIEVVANRDRLDKSDVNAVIEMLGK